MTDNSGLSRFHIGTSGWSYKHWSGVFYPENVKPAKYLEYYLTRFDCVELNASFYYPPKITVVKSWVKRTPESFKFCPKMSRYITHLKRLADPESSLEYLFSVFEPMKDRIGPILIQLPPSLKFDASLVIGFFDILKEKYNQYRFAIEVRHKSWVSDTFFNILKDYNIAFVVADSGRRFPYYEAVTTDFVYMRLHGHEKLYASLYAEWELKEYAAKIYNWVVKGREVWAFFNNDFGGYAVKNALKINEILTSKE